MGYIYISPNHSFAGNYNMYKIACFLILNVKLVLGVDYTEFNKNDTWEYLSRHSGRQNPDLHVMYFYNSTHKIKINIAEKLILTDTIVYKYVQNDSEIFCLLKEKTPCLD